MTDNRRINIKAVGLGVLTDVGGSLVLGLMFGVVMVVALAVQGVPQNGVSVRLQEPIFLIPGMIFGFGFTLLGGFVAGRIAKQKQVLHGAIVGAISLLFGLPFWTSIPMWYNLLALAGGIPLGMLGGYIARPSRKKDENVQQSGGG